jgi:tetratricopeptide (TPR) repeat protein
MLRFLMPVLAASAMFAAGPTYEVSGKILPRGRASVALSGITAPFSASTFVLPGERFHFKKVAPGLYTLVIFMRRRGEVRQTVEVGPGTADRRNRIVLKLELKDSDFVFASALRTHTVSAAELAIPAAAFRDFRDAQKELSKRNAEGAVKKLEDAVDRAPQFSAAWNNLGTIAYQSGNYARAEECFREAMAQDPQSYEALVNLGGVLVTLHKLDEALKLNAQAALTRPNDALAQSQLGITYYLAGQLEPAKKHLEIAWRTDPAHFSYPQLVLYEIHLKEGDAHAAAEILDDFLTHHPDWPRAAEARKSIAELRSR